MHQCCLESCWWVSNWVIPSAAVKKIKHVQFTNHASFCSCFVVLVLACLFWLACLPSTGLLYSLSGIVS